MLPRVHTAGADDVIGFLVVLTIVAVQFIRKMRKQGGFSQPGNSSGTDELQKFLEALSGQKTTRPAPPPLPQQARTTAARSVRVPAPASRYQSARSAPPPLPAQAAAIRAAPKIAASTSAFAARQADAYKEKDVTDRVGRPNVRAAVLADLSSRRDRRKAFIFHEIFGPPMGLEGLTSPRARRSRIDAPALG